MAVYLRYHQLRIVMSGHQPLDSPSPSPSPASAHKKQSRLLLWSPCSCNPSRSFSFSSAPFLPGPQPQQMRGLCPGALHRTAAQASRPATHILASSWPSPLAPPPRPAAPDRLFVRSQALRSFVPPLDQLGSNRRALGRLVDSFRHHLAPKQPSHSRPRLADGPGSSSLSLVPANRRKSFPPLALR